MWKSCTLNVNHSNLSKVIWVKYAPQAQSDETRRGPANGSKGPISDFFLRPFYSTFILFFSSVFPLNPHPAAAHHSTHCTLSLQFEYSAVCFFALLLDVINSTQMNCALHFSLHSSTSVCLSVYFFSLRRKEFCELCLAKDRQTDRVFVCKKFLKKDGRKVRKAAKNEIMILKLYAVSL